MTEEQPRTRRRRRRKVPPGLVPLAQRAGELGMKVAALRRYVKLGTVTGDHQQVGNRIYVGQDLDVLRRRRRRGEAAPATTGRRTAARRKTAETKAPPGLVPLAQRAGELGMKVAALRRYVKLGTVTGDHQQVGNRIYVGQELDVLRRRRRRGEAAPATTGRRTAARRKTAETKVPPGLVSLAQRAGELGMKVAALRRYVKLGTVTGDHQQVGNRIYVGQDLDVLRR
ncbi:MAG: hypothetical protein HY535_06170, partial [Chloroflexi bacterium]|nr:hypothetical protein [Chloroflexota bacterium]